MKELYREHRAQIGHIRAKSGVRGDSSPEVAGIHRAVLMGLSVNFNLEEQLGELSNDEVAKLLKLVDKVDKEIDSRFIVFSGDRNS